MFCMRFACRVVRIAQPDKVCPVVNTLGGKDRLDCVSVYPAGVGIFAERRLPDVTAGVPKGLRNKVNCLGCAVRHTHLTGMQTMRGSPLGLKRKRLRFGIARQPIHPRRKMFPQPR